VRIGVARRHTKTVRPRMTGELGSDHESITLTCVLELTPDFFRQGLLLHPVFNHYIDKYAF